MESVQKQKFSIRNISIGSKFIIMMVGLIISVIIVLSVVSYWVSSSSIKNEATGKLAAAAELKTQTITKFISDRYGEIHVMTGTDILKRACKNLVETIQNSTIDAGLSIDEKRKLLIRTSADYHVLSQYIDKYDKALPNFSEIKFVAMYDIRNRRGDVIFKEGDQIISANGFTGNVKERSMYTGGLALAERRHDGMDTEKYDCPLLYSSSIEWCSELNKSSIHMSHAMGKPGMAMDDLRKKSSLKDRFSMMMIFDINTNTIDNLLADTSGMGKTGESFLIQYVNDRLVMLTNSRTDKDAALKADLTGLAGYEEHMKRNETRRGTEYCENLIYTNQKGIKVLGHNHIIDIGANAVGLITQIHEDEVFSAVSHLLMMMIMLGCAIVVISVIAAVSFSKTISVPLQYGVEYAATVASGDFTCSMDEKYLNRGDEIGKLAVAMNNMSHQLNDIISSIILSATNLTEAVQEIASGNENLSQRTSEQASSLEEIASTIEEATATINQNADNAIKAKELMDTGSGKSKEGNQIAEKAVDSINDMNKSSKKVAEIIAVINEIAFQTNLLALNASVEAARAGEQGRGFAVVAGEVRNLAQRSGTAAKEIELLIKDTVGKVEMGTELVNKTGNALAEIAQAAEMTARLITEITAASSEQKQGINQINIAITEMDSMTQQNASLVEEIASASEEMSNLARELILMMDQFKVKQDEFTMSQSKNGARHISHILKSEKTSETSSNYRNEDLRRDSYAVKRDEIDIEKKLANEGFDEM